MKVKQIYEISLRALLIQIGVKPNSGGKLDVNSLRALLIQIGVKRKREPSDKFISLRALLIQIGVKLGKTSYSGH